MKTIKEMHVLVGLPGSGKTTFTKQFNLNTYTPSKRNEADIIDFDAIFKQCFVIGCPNSTRENIECRPLPVLYHNKVVLDGLFVNQEEVEWVLGLFLNDAKFRKQHSVEKIIVHVWKPDKDACRWNDMARHGSRHIFSQFSIDCLDIGYIDVDDIEEKFGIKTQLKLHDIIRAPAYQVMVAQNNIRNNGKYLESSTWSLGGTSYGLSGSEHHFSAEQPVEFEEFDELLERICPQITYLQYKKVNRACVTMEERPISDYYTSGNEGYWRCDLEKLYEMLTEMELYKIEEAE
jgi:hypothetical protein